jgi:hypothetical protein
LRYFVEHQLPCQATNDRSIAIAEFYAGANSIVQRDIVIVHIFDLIFNICIVSSTLGGRSSPSESLVKCAISFSMYIHTIQREALRIAIRLPMRVENVGSVQRVAGSSCPDNRMNFIDEENHIAIFRCS